ncbi:ethanolamine ammonia-lyase subunit EutB [Paracoccus mutanolyticus]|nr:ethanolamine ammonia-lyase subunit EutB [Paracoccus mutanolyticus]
MAVSVLDGLLHGAGDAVIGINPASDNRAKARRAGRECRGAGTWPMSIR